MVILRDRGAPSVPDDGDGDEGEARTVEEDPAGVDQVPASPELPPALGVAVWFVPANMRG
jgi:hypothetical protein